MTEKIVPRWCCDCPYKKEYEKDNSLYLKLRHRRCRECDDNYSVGDDSKHNIKTLLKRMRNR